MALTPEDVVTKVFQHVRFKEGFDPDEVDDFLDEIVVEWRKTIEENNQLKAKIAELESGQSAAPVAATPAPVEASAPSQPVAVAAPVATDASPAQSAGIIELAQRLHDEHVAEGKSQRDQLIADAQAQATRIVVDAEAKGRAETDRLAQEREVLETRITELRGFERDYRANLRSYIEGQLKDLEQTTTGPTPAGL